MMKFTLAWLKEHLDTDRALGEIADKLTMIGLEVERIEDKGKQLAPFIIARVVEAKQHPNADRLRVCMVDTGDGRAGAGGVRRAECAHRHEGRVRAAGRLHPRQGHDARGRHHPRRREPRHAGVGSSSCKSPTTTKASSICRPMRRSARATRTVPGSTIR